MNTTKAAFLACFAGFALCLGACNSNQTAGTEQPAAMAVKADNTVCPYSKAPVADGVTTVSHKGSTIGFCCEGCAGRFAKLSDAERDALLAQMPR
jgi:hypothetical protein